MSELTLGDIIEDRYEITDFIGEGGMGSVYAAREIGLERFVAIKLLKPSPCFNERESYERFKREGKLLSRLKHPHVPLFYRFGIHDGKSPYIAMELLRGKCLRNLIDERGPLPVEQVLQIFFQLSATMEFMHSSGVVHRDLKPSNVMIIAESPNASQIKILDLGLARIVSERYSSQHLTQTGEIVGTTFYMSPEQCLGKPVDGRSDIYSIGCMMYEAVTGQPPFSSDNPIGLMHKHVCEPVPSLKQILPEGLEHLIYRCLAKELEQRYQSTADLSKDLALIMNEKGHEVRAHAKASTPSKGYARHRKSALIIGATLIMLVFVCLMHRPATIAHLQNDRSKPLARIHRSPVEELIAINAACKVSHLDPIEVKVKKLHEGEEAIQRIIEELRQSKEHSKNVALQFAAITLLSDLIISDMTYRSNSNDQDASGQKRLLGLLLSSGNRALQLATKPDGTYYLQAAAIFDAMAQGYQIVRDYERAKQYQLQCLQIIRSTEATADFALDEKLLLYNAEEQKPVCLRKIADAEAGNREYALAEQHYRESLSDTLSMCGHVNRGYLDACFGLCGTLGAQHRPTDAKKFITEVKDRLEAEHEAGELADKEQSDFLIILADASSAARDPVFTVSLAEKSVKLLDGSLSRNTYERYHDYVQRLQKAFAPMHDQTLTARLQVLIDRLEHLLRIASLQHT